MRLIDLFNMIVDCDELPNKIKIRNDILLLNKNFHLPNLQDYYYMENEENATWKIWYYDLTDDIEIIEERNNMNKECNKELKWSLSGGALVNKEDINNNILTSGFEDDINKLIKRLDKFNLIYTDLISDGYHTFESLYYQRCILFAIICNQNKKLAWKSKKHSDETMYDDYFIVGINTPAGQYTYHYNMQYWYYFDVKELENAPEWDGHTENDCFERLFSLLDWEDCFKSRYMGVPFKENINE